MHRGLWLLFQSDITFLFVWWTNSRNVSSSFLTHLVLLWLEEVVLTSKSCGVWTVSFIFRDLFPSRLFAFTFSSTIQRTHLHQAWTLLWNVSERFFFFSLSGIPTPECIHENSFLEIQRVEMKQDSRAKVWGWHPETKVSSGPFRSIASPTPRPTFHLEPLGLWITCADVRWHNVMCSSWDYTLPKPLPRIPKLTRDPPQTSDHSPEAPCWYDEVGPPGTQCHCCPGEGVGSTDKSGQVESLSPHPHSAALKPDPGRRLMRHHSS